MAFTFQKFVHKGDEFIKEIAEELGHPEDTDRAYRIFRAVAHTLRDNLTPEENLHFIAQLPMTIKGVYVDKWAISSENIRKRDKFVEAVQEKNTTNNQQDLMTPDQTERAIEKVFNVFRRHVSEGEIEDVLKMMPEEIRPIMA